MAEIFASGISVLKISAKTCGVTLTPADGMRSCLRIDLAGIISCGVLSSELGSFWCWRSEPDQVANSRQKSEVWRLGFGLMFSFVMAEWMAKALTRTGEEDLFVAWPGGLKSHRVEKSSSSQVKKSSSLQVGKSVCCQSFWSRCLVGWKCCWVVGGDDCLGGWQGW